MNIPNGYKLVPVEPTDEMIMAFITKKAIGLSDEYPSVRFGGNYRDMLDAAPTPPQPIYDEAKERELFEAFVVNFHHGAKLTGYVHEEKITFVNSEPAKCGCKMEFSSGGGHYSDVVYITPCVAHSGSKPFGPVEVKRDADGWWYHPNIPSFGEGEDPAPYIAWVKEQGLELKGWHSGDEIEDLPDEDAACTAWNPESPGPEWFLMGIFDTEDGPYVQWARREVTP